MGRFIYVIDEGSRDKLIKLGFEMAKADEARHVWVFENKAIEKFASELDFPYVTSDTLTF